MSDKKRRDITLGEMQDECKKRETICGLNSDNPCPFDKVCDAISPHGFSTDGKGGDAIFPCHWNLTDPPRFKEAQMAFWRGWYAMGAKFVRRWKVGHITFLNEYGDTIGTIERHLDLADVLEVGETLDLTELFGKDCTERIAAVSRSCACSESPG